MDIFPGGNNNFGAREENGIKNRDRPGDSILREDGSDNSDCNVMATLVFRCPGREKIDAQTYLEIVWNADAPKCHEKYGVPPSCVFEDCATLHAACV